MASAEQITPRRRTRSLQIAEWRRLIDVEGWTVKGRRSQRTSNRLSRTMGDQGRHRVLLGPVPNEYLNCAPPGASFDRSFSGMARTLDARALRPPIRMGSDAPELVGRGDIDWVCADCGHILAKNMEEWRGEGLVPCYPCGANSTIGA